MRKVIRYQSRLLSRRGYKPGRVVRIRPPSLGAQRVPRTQDGSAEDDPEDDRRFEVQIIVQ